MSVGRLVTRVVVQVWPFFASRNVTRVVSEMAFRVNATRVVSEMALPPQPPYHSKSGGIGTVSHFVILVRTFANLR